MNIFDENPDEAIDRGMEKYIEQLEQDKAEILAILRAIVDHGELTQETLDAAWAAIRHAKGESA